MENSTQEKTKSHSLKFCYFIAVINTVLMSLLFYFLAGIRNVDGDEGLYLEAARLVAQGKKLYLDFFFQQMPLTPYLYAGWMKIFGFSLFSGRALSALLTALAGLAVLLFAARKTQKLWIINLVAVLFFANGMVLAWAPVVKTHPLTMLGLTTSCILLLEWRKRQTFGLLILSAVAIGLGVNGRLTLGPLLIYYFLFVLFSSKNRRWLNGTVFFLTVALISIPTFYYFYSDPQLFIRYNLQYHTQVYPGVVDSVHRMYTVENLIQQIQFLFLIAGAQGVILLFAKKKFQGFWNSDEFFILLLIFIYFATHMASAEPYTQYFVAVVPLLILLFIPLFEAGQNSSKVFVVPLVGIFLLIYLFQARPNMDFEIASMLSDRPEWKIENINRVVRRAKKVVKKGDSCLTWWPGFAFMIGCDSAPGMENHMRNYAVQRLLGKELKAYKMMSDEELLAAIQNGKYHVIIDSLYHIDSPYYEDIRVALAQNYWEVGYGVKIRAPQWFKALADKH